MGRISVHPKKQPAQLRSREMVQKILDAAVAVLRRDGIEGFTTNHVAREAGISVASIYQFFPNKLAIVYRLYQIWLSELSDRIAAESDRWRGRIQWEEFASRLSAKLSEEIVDQRAEYELLRAMWSHRKLLELDRKHSDTLAARVADDMAAYGSKMPRPALTRIAEFANELHTLAAERAVDATPAERRLIDECARIAYVALWRHALEANPPARPARSEARRAGARGAHRFVTGP
jgi:AcrR family transcriptional regulator